MAVSDLHTVSDRMLNSLLYPLAGWGISVAGLFMMGEVQWALQLLYPLAMWQTALTAKWGTNLLKRLREGEVDNPQANAGVTSVGRILAASALSPVLVFFCRDPFEPSNWSTSFGVVVVAAAAWVMEAPAVRAATPIAQAILAVRFMTDLSGLRSEVGGFFTCFPDRSPGFSLCAFSCPGSLPLPR